MKSKMLFEKLFQSVSVISLVFFLFFINDVNAKEEGVVTVDVKLVQDKVLKNADGTVSAALTLHGEDMPLPAHGKVQPVDLVVVLDRSGSMEGQKISDARNAVINLMERMNSQDRMAVISYANDARMVSQLVQMNHDNRYYLARKVSNISSGGGTNLGSGLEYGIETLLQNPRPYRQRKIILISDGLANQGITNLHDLGNMAARAAEHNLTVSTVGVGYDFNEVLMTTIADHGLGNYYFMENPNAFARVFEKEFNTARKVVASGIEIRFPLQDSVKIVDAGGYPIKVEDGHAVIRPGDLLGGQTRKLYLSLNVPTTKEQDIKVGQVEVRYLHKEESYSTQNVDPLMVTCVKDEREVVESIDKDSWSELVVKDSYNKLKNKVADSIRAGEKEAALQSIEEYEAKNRSLNMSVGSAEVSDNLDSDVQQLKQSVEDTFSGAPAAVAEKKKMQSKILQYESYQQRRDKQ